MTLPGPDRPGDPLDEDVAAIFGLDPAAVDSRRYAPEIYPKAPLDRRRRRAAVLVLAGLLVIAVIALQLRKDAPRPGDPQLAAAEAPVQPAAPDLVLPRMMTLRPVPSASEAEPEGDEPRSNQPAPQNPAPNKKSRLAAIDPPPIDGALPGARPSRLEAIGALKAARER